MLNSEKGQSLIEVLVVLVLAAMMVVALITIILLSLKNAQFAQNQTTATKLAQDTIDNIRILRDSNQENTLTISGGDAKCFNELWNNVSGNSFDCRTPSTYINCYYQLNTNNNILDRITNLPTQKVVLTNNPGLFRQIIITQHDPNNPNDGINQDEVKVAVEVSWTDSSGEHSSNLETYLIKPNYECVE